MESFITLKKGFKQICESLFNACEELDVEFHFNVKIDSVSSGEEDNCQHLCDIF